MDETNIPMYSRKYPYLARIESALLCIAILAFSTAKLHACTNPTSTFPIQEDFESNAFINWTQDTNDDFDWLTFSGATASGGTGPTAAFDGSYYAYTEASTPNNPSKVANLISPCFLVQSGVSTKISFAYHMLGAGMGSFNLDISNDDGVSWTTLWGLSGDQGSNWLQQSVNLDAYIGQAVKLRFNVVTGTYESDVSIDNVVISTEPPFEFDDEVCYFISDGYGSSTPDTFYTFNYNTGAITPIGPTGTNAIEAMAMDTVSKKIYTTNYATFGTIDPTTGVYSSITNSMGSVSGSTGSISISDIDGMTFDNVNNIIWATIRLNASSNGLPDDVLIKINPTTGMPILSAFGDGVDFVVIDTPENDIDDIAMSTDETLYAISNLGGTGNQMFGYINKLTGGWTSIGDYGVDDVESLAFTASGQLVATSGKDGGDSNEMYTIDAGTGIATFIGSVLPAHDVEACDCLSGLLQNLQIGDKVWEDINADGIQDSGEPGVSNVVVNLLTSSGNPYLNDVGVPTTTSTDANGFYLFDGLTIGEYIVEFVLPTDTNFSPQNSGSDDEVDSDANIFTGRSHIITLQNSTNDLSIDAGILFAANCPDVIVNGTNVLCYGESTVLTSTVSGGIGTCGYQWESSADNLSWSAISGATGNTLSITGQVEDTYYRLKYSCTGNTYCPDAYSSTFLVEIVPDLQLDIAFSGTLCLEENSQLTAILSGGLPEYQYSWTGPSSFTSTLQTIDVDESGNYYVTVTDAAGCTESYSAYVYEAYQPFIFTLNTEVCEGESVTLSVNSSSAVLFNWGPNADNATTSSVTVTPSPPSTEYTVTVTNDLGCQTSASAVIDVISSPVVNVTGPGTICEGETSSLSPADGGTWISTNSSVATVSNSGVVTGVSAGSATFIFTNSTTQCESDPTTAITVLDRPTVSVTGPTSICEGFTSQLSPTTGGTWVSNDVDVATVDNNGVVTGVSSGSTSFVFTNSTTNCASDASLPITVEQNPTVTVTGATTICIGATTTLSPSSGGTWTSSDNAVATVSNSGIVMAISDGTANFTFTNNQGCVSLPTATVTVDPEGTANISGESILCEGETTTLTVSTTGGTWTSSNNSIATISSSGVVTAISSGNVTISYEYGENSCFQDPNFGLEVRDKPTVSISGTTTICVGESTQLTTTGSGGYWTSGDSNIAIVSSTGIVVGISAGTVSFSYTSSNGCESDATGLITVDPAVEVDVDFNGSLCLKEDSQLSALVTGGTASYTYAWTGPGGFASSAQTIDIAINGNYNITVTDSKGCSSNTTAFVYEAYEPFIFALNTDVCEGEEVTLSVNSSSSATYQWGPNAGNSTEQSVTVTPGVPSTSYNVTVTNSIGCTTEATAVIGVDPSPTIEITGPNSICENGTTQLTPTSGGIWTSSDYSVATISNTGLVTGNSNGIAAFTFKSDATGCYSDPSAPITVADNGFISISGENQICIGENPTLTASVPGGSWSSSNVGVAQVSNTGVITPNAQGSATITYTPNSSECYFNATYEINIHPLPNLNINGPSTICENEQTYLSSSTSGEWTSSNPSIANVSNTGVVTGFSAGTVTFSFVSTAGCPKTLDTLITVVGSPQVSLNGPGDICINSTTSLLPNSGGVWNSSNTNIATVSSSGIVTGNSAGVASFTFIEFTNGCISEDMISVTVNGKPAINGLDENTLCIGETTNIAPSTGGTWASSNTAVATINNSGLITAVSAGTTHFYFTNTMTGCTSNASAPLTVNNDPVTNFTGPTSICVGEVTSISPSSEGVWSSTEVSIATISSNGEITGIAPGTVHFIYTSNNSGCSSGPSETLTIEDPTEIQITGPSNICVGENTTFTPSSGGVWASSNINIATITNSGIVTGIAPGEVTFTFNSNAGCTSNPSAYITIDPKPSIGFTGPTSICIGTTTNLSPAIGGSWTSSNPSIASIDNNGLVTGLSAGSATFTYIDNISGCSATTATILNVYSNPTISIAGEDQICIGHTTNMIPSSGGVWVSSDNSIAGISPSGVVTGLSAGIVTFTFYENGTGCVSNDSDPITVMQNPVVNITGDNFICEGEITTLSPSSGGSWTSNNVNVATVTNQGIVTGIAQGLAKFIFISDEGCSSYQTSPVIVFGKPSIVIDGSDLICADDIGQILPSTGGTWSSTNTSVATIDNNGIFTAISAGTVRFIYTDSSTGCISDESAEVTVNDAPEISIIGPSNICLGETTNLFPSAGGTWTSLNPSVATIENNGIVTGNSPGQARFLFTSIATGCVSDTSSFITVEPGPAISFTGPQDICIGETTSITPSTGGIWMSTNNAVATIDNNGLITGISQGTARFIYTETSTGCNSVLSETLIVNGKPSVLVSGSNVICIDGTTNLSPSTGGTWTSLQPAIATVDQFGNVTGVSSGIAHFMFTDDFTGCDSDGTLSVTVQDGIDVSITGDAQICLGYTTTLFPSSGGFWTSSNPSIASVSNLGVVKAKAPGVVTFEFIDATTGCAANGPTDPVTIEMCTNHDFNVTLVNLEIQGNVNTNDVVPNGTTYGEQAILISKPPSSYPILNLNQDGTYSFSANKEGKYIYKVPVCIPPLVAGCPTTYLEINVIDGIYSHANPVSNIEFSTTFANVDELLEGIPVDIDAITNDDCVFTSGCELDPASVSVNGGATNGSTSVNGTGIITYTPEPGYIGKDTIYYKVCVLGNPTECSESFQVVTVNDPTALNSVVAADDFTYTLKETPVSGNVMDNDSDPEGDEISVVPIGSLLSPMMMTEGEYYIEANGDYSFTPTSDFSGSVEIVYTLCDNATEPKCTNATLHLLVFNDISIKLRVYLEGALINNGGEFSNTTGLPLMRDDLRESPYTGVNYIPVSDPYTFMIDPFMNTPLMFYKMGPGLMNENTFISDSAAVFSVVGDNAIVDWVYVELRSKDDYNVTIATRSGLVQRDGDVVDLDGVQDLRFNGVNVDSFYVVVKHRSHLGAMSEKVENDDLVDFTSPDYPVFNYGTTKDEINDYTGLSQKADVVSGYMALWAGDFDSNGQVKFTNPDDDVNILFIDVLFSSPEFLINYNNAFGYFTGDYDMNSKAKYTNPEDDMNFLFGQVLLYPLNTQFFANFNGMIEQIPPRL